MIVKQDTNKDWYIYRITSSNHAGKRKKKNPTGRNRTYRNWFLAKYQGKQNTCIVTLQNTLHLPKHFLGKRIRLKVEVME